MRTLPSGNNVWLASYPKSGNTWMRIALTSLRGGGNRVDLYRMENGIGVLLAYRRWLDDTLDVDSSDLTVDEILLLRPKIYRLLDNNPAGPTIWKIHDRWERTADGDALFPADATKATIYILRDPRDVAVSFSHHFGVGLDATIGLMADPTYRVAAKPGSSHYHVPQIYSSWSDHVASWVDRSGLDPIVIRYEDMVADLAPILKRISQALGWHNGDAEIAGAVNATRFELLREQEAKEGFTEMPPTRRPFFRRGIAGGWRDTLTPAQSARIEQDHGAMMGRFGYL